MTVTIVPLTNYLAKIADPRKAKGLRHPLIAILCLCCAAMLAGAKNPKAIANWVKHRPDPEAFLRRLGFPKGYGPSKSTLYRVLSLLPPEALETQLGQWAADLLAQLGPPEDGQPDGIALDGKTLRGSRQQGARFTHLLSALSQRLGLTLNQVAVDDKTNEIGAVDDLLVDLLIAGRVFTMDALHTQRDTAQTIVAHQADYVMLVKPNQPQLYDDIATLFTDPQAKAFLEDQAGTVEKGHGRLEIRTLQTSTALNDYLEWPGVQQVFRLDRQVTLLKAGRERAETVYGLTSLSPQRAGAIQLLQFVRGQWSIENRSHWVRDVTFGEDRSQVRAGRLPHILAAMRNCVIGLARLLHFRFLPDAFEFFAARPLDALTAIGC